MSWIRIDDRAPWHRKILDAGPAAAWLWVCGLAYANQQTAHDGFVPESAIPFLPIKDAESIVPELQRVGLWDRVEGGYIIHDYHDFQPTKEEVEELRAARSKAGQAGGKKSGEARRKQRSEARPKQTESKNEASGKPDTEAKANPVPARPDPVHPEEKTPLPPAEATRVDPIRDFDAATAVACWSMGVRSVTQAQAGPRPSGEAYKTLVGALREHCPPGENVLAWAERAGVAYAKASRGTKLSAFAFEQWISSGGFVPDAPKPADSAPAPSPGVAKAESLVPRADIDALLAGAVFREGAIPEKLS